MQITPCDNSDCINKVSQTLFDLMIDAFAPCMWMKNMILLMVQLYLIEKCNWKLIANSMQLQCLISKIKTEQEKMCFKIWDWQIIIIISARKLCVNFDGEFNWHLIMLAMW